jgi:hypothetical protein
MTSLANDHYQAVKDHDGSWGSGASAEFWCFSASAEQYAGWSVEPKLLISLKSKFCFERAGRSPAIENPQMHQNPEEVQSAVRQDLSELGKAASLR